jgi:hypothetical protein
MEINLQGGAAPQALPVAKGQDFPVKTKTQSNAGYPGVPEVNTSDNAIDAQRYERLLAAAQNLFKDVYAVSDNRFTIYKDSSGQYITRYTSLRDGKVTYIPEPNMLQYMESRRAQREAILNVNV